VTPVPSTTATGPSNCTGVAAELGEQRRPPAQHDRHQLDADLVEQTGLQALPGHLPAVDDDVLVPASSFALATAASMPSVTKTKFSSSSDGRRGAGG
jgi:hypothetical protein